MPIYHFSVKPVRRSQGQSATAGGAYRSATESHDLTTGQTFDYTRRQGVEHSEILLPSGREREFGWALNRSALWNEAEAVERRKDSRTAREYEFALPKELDAAQRLELSRRFSQMIADRFTVAADLAIHAPHRDGDRRNYHVHLYTTTRELTARGLGRKTDFELSNSKRKELGLQSTGKELKDLRKLWGDHVNTYFRELGMDLRIDHRSLKDQGIERAPTTHLGPSVTGLERRGKESFVLERIGEERVREASRQRKRAQALTGIKGEALEVAAAIGRVSNEILAAKRGMGMGLELGKEPQKDLGSEMGSAGRSLEEIRREGREKWAEMRAAKLKALAAEFEQERNPDRKREFVQTPKLTLEETRAQAREKWAAYRLEQLEKEKAKAAGLEKGQGLEMEKEKEKEKEKAKDLGKEEGYGLDFDS